MTTQAGDGDANDYEERCLHEQTCAWHPQPREVHEPLWSIASRFKIFVFHYVFQYKDLNICVSFNISSTVSAYTCRTHSWLLWRDPDRSCRRCAQKPVRQVNKQLFKLSWLPKSPASNLSGLGTDFKKFFMTTRKRLPPPSCQQISGLRRSRCLDGEDIKNFTSIGN